MSLFKNTDKEQNVMDAYKSAMLEEATYYAPTPDSVIKTIVSEDGERLNESVEEATVSDSILSEGAISAFMQGELGAPGADDAKEWLEICEGIQAKLADYHAKVSASLEA
jgi:hypothetical protein